MHPPKYAVAFLRWFCREDYLEEIEGDLTEVFQKECKKSPRRSRWKFIWSVMKYLRPRFIKPLFKHQRSSMDMYKNYFKMGWRNLLADKVYSSINIGGLAVGMAACLLIALFIKDEMSYDTHYANQKNVYRLLGVVTEEGNLKKGTAFPAPMASVLKTDFPEVEESGRFNNSELFGAGSNQVRPAENEDNTYDEGFVYMDQSLVSMLPLKFVYGNPAKALSQPNAIVITKRKAEKYFPNENPVGKVLIVNNNSDRPYTIGGVVEDFKPTSHIQFDFLIGMAGLEFWKDEQSFWGASNYATYISVAEGTDPKALETKLSKHVIDKYFIPSMVKGGVPMSEIDKLIKEKKAHIELQPLRDIHLFSKGVDDGLLHGDIQLVWMFGGIAVFILLIAVVNFVNLSTAKSANRAKEVGLRKVVGSLRSNLVTQFLSESVLVSMISFILGTALAWMMMPYFNSISDKVMEFPWAEWWTIPSLFALALLVGILAGLYPSFYLTSFKPIQVLKGNLTRGAKSSPLRSSLVIFQFTTSILLIIGTTVVYRQMNFILNKEVGYDKEQVLLIQGTNTLGTQVVPFADELRALQPVVEVTTGDYLPVRGSMRNGNSFYNEGRTNIDPNVSAQFWRVDATYIATLGMKVVEGRNFDRDLASDSSAIIINQKMAKELGGNMLGKRITNYAGLWTVIGVVEDFHFESLREDIQPLSMVLGTGASVLAVKMRPGDMKAGIQALTRVWDKFSPHQPIRYSFLDERYAAMYADLQQTGKIFTTFSVLAIVVACLGLFALSAFMVEQRSKEISVRLVLGASVNSVFKLLTWNFVKLVMVAFLIAAPLGWYLMNHWLRDYVYKTKIGWEIFAMTGAIAILIALLTISFQSAKAAMMSPIKGLRSE